MTRTRPSFLGMTRHFINSRRDRRSIGVEHFWSKTLGRLADMVRSAKLNSRFYAELYKDIDPDNFTLEELPTTSKNLLMDNFDDVLTVRDVNYKQILDFTGDPAKVGQLLQGKYVVAHTSGTTGVRGYFINSMDEWAQTITQSLVPPAKAHILMLLDQVATLPVRPFKRWRALSIIATGGHYLSPLAYIFTPRLKDVLVDLKTVDLFTPVDDLVKLINEFKPTYLQSYPSVLHTLVLEAAAGRMTHKPRIVLGGAEPFPLEVKKLMLQVWPGVLVDELYGATECLPMAKPCQHHRLHWGADWSIIEPVNADGEPVELGEMSQNVYVTNLINRTQPIIRYELTDSVRILPDPCPCGSHLPAIEVMGRTNDILYLPTDNNDTARVMPLPMIAAFLGIRDLQNYRVLQTANDEIRVEYVPDRGADLEHLKSQIARAVEARIQAERGAVGRIKFDYKVVDDIERDRYSGKIKQVQRLIDP